MKKRSYEDRIRVVKHISFTPLIFSATSRMAYEASTFYKHLASLLSERWTNQYAAFLGWICCYLSFLIITFSYPMFKGFSFCSWMFGQPFTPTEVDLVQAELKFFSAT